MEHRLDAPALLPGGDTGGRRGPRARAVVDGVEDYRSFAPPGWTPPSLAGEVDACAAARATTQAWCLLAEARRPGASARSPLLAGGAPPRSPVGEPGAWLTSATSSSAREPLGYRSWAGALHAAAVDAARERGFTEMRLFTAAGQARARRFYEREGWVQAGDELHDPVPNLVLIEYHLARCCHPSGAERQPLWVGEWVSVGRGERCMTPQSCGQARRVGANPHQRAPKSPTRRFGDATMGRNPH